MMVRDTERQHAAYGALLAARLLDDCEVMATYAALENLARALSGQTTESD